MSAWRIAHATCVGTSHLSSDTPCQDALIVDFAQTLDQEPTLLVAIADGAGSADLSHRGAAAACTAAILSLKSDPVALAESDSAVAALLAAFEQARQEVLDLATRESLQPRQLASTLLLAVVGPHCAAFGQVGDGACIWGSDDGYQMLHWPHAEALNLTDFLTQAPLAETLRVIAVSDRLHAIACSTDGLASILLDFRAQGPHGPTLDRLLTQCRELDDESELCDRLRYFLDSDAVNARTDDDKALLLATRVNGRSE